MSDAAESYVLTTVRADGELEGKLEDIHANPANGKQLIFSAQNNGLYLMDVRIQFDSNGNVVPDNSTVDISNVLTDDNTLSTFDDPDNLTWSPSGYIYVQEDGSNAGGPDHEIWRLLLSDPSGTLTRVGQGHTETSGIIDVSDLAGFAPNTIYLFSVMGGSGLSQLVTLVNTDAICPVVLPGTQVGSVTDSELFEISGLAASPQNPGVLWVHNDGGNDAELYALGTSGDLLGTYTLEGVSTNIDREDMAIGPGPAPGVPYLYIADTGDNNTDRNSVTIYRVPEPNREVIPSGVLTGVEELSVQYPGNPYDCETLLVDPRNGDMVLVTRDRASSSVTPRISGVFNYPAAQQNPSTTFTLIKHPASELSSFHNIKGGDVSRAVNQAGDYQVILRPSQYDTTVDGMLWTLTSGTALGDVFSQAFCRVPLAAEEQGEAVSFNAAGNGYYTISEEVGSGFSPVPVYFYGSDANLPPVNNEDVYLSITLTAIGADGDPLTYTIVSSPAKGSLSGTGATWIYTQHSNFNGDDSFTFFANDGKVNSAVATVTITVNPINDAPVAEAGPDQTVFVDDVVSLDGTNSSDPEADTLTYAWTQTGGSTVILSDANAVQSTFTALLGSETLEFEVEVSDGALSSTDRVVVTVNEIVNDAFVSQEPTVTNGLVVGSIDATMFSYGQVQTLTEARSGRKGCKALEVEYVLETTAPSSSITNLVLHLDYDWTAIDSGEFLEAFIWNVTSGNWGDLTATWLDDGSFDAVSPEDYVDGSRHIRVLFRDSLDIHREKADSLSIDLLWAQIDIGVPDAVAPAAPTGLLADAGEFVVDLDWNDNSESDLLGYIVYRHDAVVDTYGALHTDPVLKSALQDASVEAGMSYSYSVTAIDFSGNESDLSEALEVMTVNENPSSPAGVTATAGDGQVPVDWDENTEPDLTGYHVYRSETSGGTFSRINGSVIDTNGVIDTGLMNGTTYYYKVSAIDLQDNESELSEEVSAKPTLTPTITLTANGYKVKGKHTIDLSCSGAALVDIYRNGVLYDANISGGSYTDATNRKGGATYVYQVCEAGNPANCSNEVTVTF